MGGWELAHRKALLASLPVGAIAGLAVGFVTSRAAQAWGLLLWFEERPIDPIFWMLAGAILAAGIIHIIRLLQAP
jgi:hypothetical protein